MSSINPHHRLWAANSRRLNKTREIEAQQLSDQRDAVAENDTWRLKNSTRLDRPFADLSSAKNTDTEYPQLNENADGSDGPAPHCIQAQSTVGLFQALLFQGHSFGDGSGNGQDAAVEATVEMRKRMMRHTDEKNAEGWRDCKQPVAANSSTGRLVGRSGALHGGNEGNLTVEEFEIADPQYGQLTIRVMKESSRWALELVTESLAQKKGIQQFASIIQAGLKTRLNIDLDIKIT